MDTSNTVEDSAKLKGRNDFSAVNGVPTGADAGVNGVNGEDTEEGKSTFDFTTLPLASLQAYILKYDLLPTLSPFVVPSFSHASSHPTYPPPPPLPYHLLNPSLPPPPPPPIRSVSPTPANRPKRRRSTRHGDDNGEGGSNVVKEPHGNPVQSDMNESKKVLAEVARRHWEKLSVKENDVMEAFSWRLKSRGRIGPR